MVQRGALAAAWRRALVLHYLRRGRKPPLGTNRSDSKREIREANTRNMSRMLLLLVLGSAALTNGHGMMVNPRPRNSIDHLADVNDPSNK